MSRSIKSRPDRIVGSSAHYCMRRPTRSEETLMLVNGLG